MTSTVTNHILDLPVEILREIFKYLNYNDLKSSSNTCSLFYQIINGGMEFQQKTLLKFQKNEDVSCYLVNKYSPYSNVHFEMIEYELIKCLVEQYGYFIKELHIKLIVFNTIADVIWILRNLPNLVTLHFGSIELRESDNSQNIINNSLSLLNELKVKNLKITGRYFDFYREIINKIIQNVTETFCLDISDPKRNFIDDFQNLRIPLNANLKELSIRMYMAYGLTFNHEYLALCSNLSKLELNQFLIKPALFEYSIQNGYLENIEYLNLSQTVDIINHNLLFSITMNLKHLKSLLLNSCGYLKDTDVVPALSKFDKLQEFQVANCSRLTDKVIFEGIAKQKNLNMKTLVLSGLRNLSEESICHCVTQFPNLICLKLDKCKLAVTNTSLRKILKNLKLLQTLDISYCYSKNITDEGFIENNELLLKNLKGLKILNICACDISNQLLLDQIEFLELKELNLNECKGILPTGLLKIAKSCPSLQSLDIIGCYKIQAHRCANILQQNGNFTRLKYFQTCKCNSPKDILKRFPNFDKFTKIFINESYCERCRYCYFDFDADLSSCYLLLDSVEVH